MNFHSFGQAFYFSTQIVVFALLAWIGSYWVAKRKQDVSVYSVSWNH